MVERHNLVDVAEAADGQRIGDDDEPDGGNATAMGVQMLLQAAEVAASWSSTDRESQNE